MELEKLAGVEDFFHSAQTSINGGPFGVARFLYAEYVSVLISH